MTELHIHHKSTKDSYFSIYSNSINKYNNVKILTTCGEEKKLLESYNNLTCFDTFIKTFYSTSVIQTPNWEINVVALDVFGHMSGPSKNVNIKFKRLRNYGNVHGIIGQSFMFNHTVYGKLDKYPTHGVYTTTAMAEGAIEGNPDDYIVNYDFDENLKF